MAVYMVERNLQGISPEALAGAQKAAIAKAAEMRADGTDIGYLRSVFAPADGRCMCLFEASSMDKVRHLNESAGLPFDRIVDALDLPPQNGG